MRWCLIVLIGVCVVPASSSADRSKRRGAPTTAAPIDPEAAAKDRARTLLAEGNRKLEQGLYLEALAAFEQAYAAFPSPKLHFNIAQTHNELGRVLDALEHYERFLRGVPEDEMPEQRALASERVFQLQGRTAHVALQVNVAGASLSVDGNPAGNTPRTEPIRFLPGAHVILVSKPGYAQQVIEVTLAPGDAVTRRVTLLTDAEAIAARREFQAAEAQRKAVEDKLRRERAAAGDRRARTRKVVRTSSWIALSVGGVAAISAGALGGLSWREADKLQNAPTTWSWADDARPHYDRAQGYRTAAIVSAIVGAVGLGVGGGLWLYGRRVDEGQVGAERRAALVPIVDGAAGVALVASF